MADIDRNQTDQAAAPVEQSLAALLDAEEPTAAQPVAAYTPHDDEPDQDAADAAPEQGDTDDEDQPSLAEVEPLLAKGDYRAIVELLGPSERASRLSPPLALIFTIAHKSEGLLDPGSEVNFLAIRSVATLMNVSPDSSTALTVAKRLVRANPIAELRARRAPRAPARVILILFGLSAGMVAGWLAGPGGVQFMEVIKTVLP